ncbi:ubiquitin-like protein [Actinobacillus pleuropneumoniae]|uniref:ubiquitin-like protein n=1 Tax=Actinobacillus pleuropneumoniae TaxID=715 RepID=UPI0034DD3A61
METHSREKLFQSKQKMQSKSTGLDLQKTKFETLVRPYSFQDFVKTSEGKSKIILVKETDSVEQVQKIIMQQQGYPIRPQNLIHGGRVL